MMGMNFFKVSGTYLKSTRMILQTLLPIFCTEPAEDLRRFQLHVASITTGKTQLDAPPYEGGIESKPLAQVTSAESV